ncbi:MAG: hypothetical protein Q7R68_10980 [Nitrospirales bacterium]|nr:hypothetical protein [Nitrospirales bacterium]
MDTIRSDNFCTTSGLLTATGAETVYDTTVTICFCVNGKAKTKGAVADQATPTLDYNTGAAFPALVGGASVANTPGHGCIVVWGMIADGTVKCMMGTHESLDMDGNFVHAPQFPVVPDLVTPFAYQVLKAGATASATAIVFGDSNWNATGFTNAIVNVFTLPKRPQVA